MTEKPIIFSAPMVRAILDGRKNMTRRVVKPQPEIKGNLFRLPKMNGWATIDPREGIVEASSLCPFGAPGDRLWVRERWQLFDPERDPIPPERLGNKAPFQGAVNGDPIHWTACYWADGELEHPTHGRARWRPSIHMPRWASRITLEITGVRVERVQEISEEDVEREGVFNRSGMHDWDCENLGYSGNETCACGAYSPQETFARLWESIHGPGSWELNPYCWVISFKVVR